MNTIQMYLLTPEVAGQWGKGTVVRTIRGVQVVEKLDYEFVGWLGDDLVTADPCFIATTALCNDLRASSVSGLSYRSMTVSIDEQLRDFEPNFTVPPFEWLVIEGRVRRDQGGKIIISTGHDANLDETTSLVVSETLLAVLKRHKLENCEVLPL